MTNQTAQTTLTSLALVTQAHKLYSKGFSIDSKLVKFGDDDDFYTGIMAVVTTPKGSYSAWALGDIEEIEALEEKALLNALLRAGVSLLAPQPTVTGPVTGSVDYPKTIRLPSVATRTLTAERAPSIFQPTATSEDSTTSTSAETAQLCAECGGVIEDYYAGASVLTAQELAEKGQERFGSAYCAKCIVRQSAKRRATRSKKTEE